jgi:xanthine dehydrogenase accessory factor
MDDIFAKVEELKRAGKNAALCIVVETTGSTPRKAGSKMLVAETGETYGTIGGGSVELKMIDEALEVIRGKEPKKIKFNLETDAAMHCGGTMEIYIEPVSPDLRLVIFGAGHVGAALAHFAKEFGFKITFVDNRPSILEKLKDKGFGIIEKNYIEAANEATFDENTYIVVTTPKHEFDEQVTGICAKKPHRYLGMIGSKRKVATARQNYLDKVLLTLTEIEKIDMPIGIKFNAQTPEEIAISILAKLIDVKNSEKECGRREA